MASYRMLPDAELLELLKVGDRAAYTEIYERYKGILHQHAYKKLGDREEAKEVVQWLFVTLWTRRETLPLETSLSGYLYTAVRNRILNMIAHKAVESRYIGSLEQFYKQGEYITDNQVREQELAAIIEKEIACLPAKMREIFEMSRKTNLSHKEIAETLRLSEQTVRTQVRNALRILRVKLGIVIYLIYFSEF